MKLFENTEEKMKEAMLSYPTPLGRDIKKRIPELINPPGASLLAIRYNTGNASNLTDIELNYLEASLKDLGIGLALCKDCGYFIVDPLKMKMDEEKLTNLTANEESTIAWVGLVRNAWDNGIAIASVDNYLEGFELKVYFKTQKLKKIFLKKS